MAKEIAFPDSKPGLTERLAGCKISYEGVTVTPKPGGLSYLENAFVESIFYLPGKDDEDSPEGRAMRAAPVLLSRDNWTLRLGIAEIEGMDAQTEDVSIGRQTIKALTVETVEAMPRALRNAALEKIREYSGISEEERDRVVFTSPSPAI